MRSISYQNGAAELVDVDTPRPAEGELLVRIEAASLNFRDTLIADGKYTAPVTEGVTLGSDAAGTVEAVGTGVDRAWIGKRVASTFYQAWTTERLTPEIVQTQLGSANPGVFSDFAILKSDGAVPLPGAMTMRNAACFPCAATAAFHAMVVRCQASAGQKILLIGSGGVSLFALQLARILDMEIAVITRSLKKVKLLEDLGAKHVVCSANYPDWPQKLAEIGFQPDIVIEVGGPGTFNKSLESIRHGGKIALIGVRAGANDKSNPLPIMLKNVSVEGIQVGSTEMQQNCMETFSENGISPVIDSVFEVKDFRLALNRQSNGDQFGKILLDFSR